MAADDTVTVDSAPDADDEPELIRSALEADYEILEELGRGGMAVVYRAIERALEREVAIKILPLARTFDSELVARFQREARLAASLEHPHIVPVYRVGQSGRVNFIVMKHVRGPSVSHLLAAEGRMQPAEVERLLLEIGDALGHAHEQGIVHRDVKPDNVMRDQTGRYVVMDFGIAMSGSDTRLTQTGGSVGTPRYMSPEQARGAELDGRSDLYSLGVVGYHCLVGRPPFEGDDPLAVLYAHLHEPLPEPALDSDEARRVYAVIERLLAKDPGRRLRRGAEIGAALRRPLASSARGSATSGRPSPLAPLTWLQGRRRRLGASAAAVAAIVAFAMTRDGAAERCRVAIPDAAQDDRAVLLDPPRTLRRGDEVRLAYVACGLTDDAPFTARVTIRPADDGGVVGRVGRFFGGGSDPFRSSWDEVADGFATARERTISPGDLAPGAYRITVEIEDDEGRDARASHDFTVVDA